MSIDFLGIGVQKSASSWLWSLLKQHNDIWMPPRKELHYFDRNLNYPSPSFLASDSIEKRLNGLEAHNVLFRKKLELELGSLTMTSDNEKIKWYLKYFFENYNDTWYKSLFREGEGRLRGEITPAYSILNKEDIAHIKELFPALKVILILRNPIDRAWSQARFYMTRNLFNINNDSDKLKEFIDSDIQISRGDYISILKNWSSSFPPEQLFIGFYDEIIDDKENFISKICSFLDIDKKVLLENNAIDQKVNVSVEIEIPLEIKKYLIDKYKEDIVYLSTVFDKYPQKWLNEI